MESHLRIALPVLMGALSLAGCCAAPQKEAVTQELPTYTYLTGRELANRVLGSVVRIDLPDGRVGVQDRGVGLIVGQSADGLVVVTAEHVLAASLGKPFGDVKSPLAQTARVRFCAPELAGIEVTAKTVRLSDPRVADILFLQLPSVAQYKPEPRLLADPGVATKGDEVWFAGQGGECIISGSAGTRADGPMTATIDDTDAVNQRIRAYVPGTKAGSSGGVLLTGRGLIGIAQTVDGGQNLVAATRIELIASAAQAAMPQTWRLERGGNLPPSLPDAAERELGNALTRYVFDARSVHLVLSGTKLNSGELADLIRSYNTAVTRFIEVKAKHDGALARYWNPGVLARYQRLRDELLSVHAVFLAQSQQGFVNEMYRTDTIPDSVRQQMSPLAESLPALQANVEAMSKALSEERRPVTDGNTALLSTGDLK